MTRLWSIRARTTLTFAVASMVLTAAVVLLVTWASTVTLTGAIDGGAAERTPSLRSTTEGDAGDWWTGSGDRPVRGPEHSSGTSLHVRGPEAVMVVAVANRTQWQWAAVGVLAAGLLAGGTGWVVSRRVLRPIDRITDTARRLSASTLHERIGLDGPDDELRRLAGTIDDLLDRLEAAFESQRRFVAQASHELRTPLAVQRTALQVGLGEDARPDDVVAVREELLEQNRRTEHLVESLLALAEADRGLDGRVDELDLAELAGQVVAGQRDHARAAKVSLTVEPSPSAVVSAEPVLVRQLVANLVDNAVEYNEPGGFVRVSAGPDGLCVENSGPAVSAADVAVLVEPFRRGAQGAASRRHSGLGLSIVAAIVRAHGWSLTVEPRPDGGLRVRVATV
ncbi:HAMP domain-containing sensor histidine kinase [Curtobacterium sp. RHCJP20]|uniref:histidine kinase n=1 Tax=Curtobacterium subtropicum TaxID=3055138 RepID=A0ABT7TJJ1_9MICO|nr:HAMP domain-containing sensor histidine kinase [Curtobacterium subtropicum]MDM7889737.1 HAMP domain-containing sensor histidine kinase [Curtobacterium subtropicum]